MLFFQCSFDGPLKAFGRHSSDPDAVDEDGRRRFDAVADAVGLIAPDFFGVFSAVEFVVKAFAVKPQTRGELFQRRRVERVLIIV